MLSLTCKVSSFLMFVFLIAVCCVLVYLAVPGLTSSAFWNGSVWSPANEEYAFIPMLWGAVICATIGILVSFPIALGIVLGHKFIFSPKFTGIVFAPLEALASVPSILFGLLGLSFLSPIINSCLQIAFPNLNEANLISGGITLAMMTLPACLLSCKDTLSLFPPQALLSAKALGVKNETIIYKLVLPSLKNPLLSCAFQAWSRGMGEAVALSMIIGRADLPWKVISPTVSEVVGANGSLEKEISSSFFYLSPISPGQTLATKLSSSELFLSWGNPVYQGSIMSLTLILLLATVGFSMFLKKPTEGSHQ